MAKPKTPPTFKNKPLDSSQRDARVWHAASSARLEDGDAEAALACALHAVDLGIQAKALNLWHTRLCARLLIDNAMPGLAVTLIENVEASDRKEHVLALQKARALRLLRRVDDAIEYLDAVVPAISDREYGRKLREYQNDMISG